MASTEFLRTIAAGQLIDPQAVTASHGRAFVVDIEDVGPGKVLHVIDIPVRRHFPKSSHCEVSAIRVDGARDGDEI